MLRNIYGLDLGTYEIKVYDQKQDTIWKEKDAVAIQNEKTIFAIGDDAYAMFEKSPENIEVVFPMQGGEISHFNNMEFLLQNLLKKGKKSANYVIAVPTDVTEVQKRAFFNLVLNFNAKSRDVRAVERGIADAVGMGIDVMNERGVFIVNLGGESTELSVLSYGGVVVNKMIKIGGVTFDEAIMHQVKRNQDFLIGRLTSEMLRRSFDIFGGDEKQTITVAGRSLITGVPQHQKVSVTVIRTALEPLINDITKAIQSLIERTPPDVFKTIKNDGIYITGGLANLKGLPEYIGETIGIKVTTTTDPELSSVRGLKEIILSEDLQKLTYSMLDENFRWMR